MLALDMELGISIIVTFSAIFRLNHEQPIVNNTVASFHGHSSYCTAFHIGGTFVVNYIVCHFGTTYMDGSTSNPLYILDIQRRPSNESLCKVWWNI